MSQPVAEIGIIGGSGLYEMAGLTDKQELRVTTPFGDPSDACIVGTLAGRRIAFLPRHGRGHRLNPSQIPFKANIFAMKQLGVGCIVSVSAVGSLSEAIAPLDMVVPDQLIDRTRLRPTTFFEQGLVVHVAFADPFCAKVSGLLARASEQEGVTTHRGGTYLAIEGPQFSTKAESALYRSWGAHIIGMTAAPEAKLAREAEICYATLACSTDYDCWHPDHDSVTADMIIRNLGKNVDRAKAIIQRVAAAIPPQRDCSCQHALKSAIVTVPDLIPASVKKQLAPLIGRYIAMS
ncbi:MAG: S-methyl-5'-thioadenosine phosphorylase [Dehalococcoidia bacterium]|nr:S-methyl-5'-thioadenosine phosphorylase [Dehalococcoidia bacterium]